VSLTGVGRPNLVPSAIAGALEMSFFGPDSPDLQLVNYLRHKTLLLVLDNFEHVLDATVLLTDILVAAPDVKLLVTSRERLNLQEEWVFAVEGLASDTAVQLFDQRAQQVQTDFSISKNSEPVMSICRAVERMPLGLELAASWLHVMSCEQIAAQLQHNLDFLATSARNAPERHRSIRAVFDHSWKLLTLDEQTAFRKLTVFRGGFEREAAELVAGASLQKLAALIDKSLLRKSAAGRYDLHELARQYAGQQLEAAGERGKVQAAHSAYYMDFLVRRDGDMKGRRQMAALHEVRNGFNNIEAAWQRATEQREYEAIRRTVNCLLNFGELTGNLSDVLEFLEQTVAAVASSVGESPHPVWDQILVRREWVHYRLAKGIDDVLVKNILARARMRNDQEEIAWCLWVLRDHAKVIGDHANALAIAEEHLTLRQSLSDPFYIAHALLGLGATCMSVGQVERGLNCQRESIAIRRKLGDRPGAANSLEVLAITLLLLVRFSEAETCLDQAIALQEEIGKNPFYSALMTDKAMLAFWCADFETATVLVQEGLAFAPEPDWMSIGSFARAVSSYAVSMSEDYARARQLCEQAKMAIFYWQGPESIFVVWGLGLACCGMGDDSTARRAMRDTLQYSLRVNSLLGQWLCLPLMSILSARSNDPHRAVELLGLYFSAPRELTAWAEKWPLLSRVRAVLETELGAEGYAAAWAKGQTLSLEQVIGDALEKSGDGV
jgi:predicted ATPase